MTGFMMQKGTIVICGDAGEALADSMYEGVVFVGGEIASLGNDAVIEEPTDDDQELLDDALARHGIARPARLPEGRRRPQALELRALTSSRPGGTRCERRREPRRRCGRAPSTRPRSSRRSRTRRSSGRYRIRGFGTLREQPLPSLDDLTFLPASLTRIPLEGYRERCETTTVLGHALRRAADPARDPDHDHGHELRRPVVQREGRAGAGRRRRSARPPRAATGACSPPSASTAATMIVEVLPSRYGANVHHLRQADGIELTIGQGAKPGTGGLLLGSKVSPEIAAIRDLPPGVDQRSPARHPDFLGPDDMIIKIEELREATDWRVPIFVKIGATRTFDDVKLAAKCGADVVVVDGMEGGTAASPEILQDHTGIPTLAAIVEARRALEDVGMFGKVQLIAAGGIRSGVDVAKAIALGADACYIGTAALIALNCNRPIYLEDYAALGTAARRLPPLPHGSLPGRHHDPGPRADGAPADRRGRRADRQLPDRDDARGPDDRAGLRQGERPRPRPRRPARADASRPRDHGHPARGHARATHQAQRPSRTRRLRAMSFLLTCPLCGPRDVYEYRYGGEVQQRPAPGSDERDLGRATSTCAPTSRAWSGRGGSIASAAGAGSRPSATRATNTVLRTGWPAPGR